MRDAADINVDDEFNILPLEGVCVCNLWLVVLIMCTIGIIIFVMSGAADDDDDDDGDWLSEQRSLLAVFVSLRLVW